MSDKVVDLQQLLEQARQREAAAREAERQRIAAEQAYQREAAQAAQEAAVFEAQIAAAKMMEMVSAVDAQAAQVQQLAEEVASNLNSLKSAISGQMSEFPVQKALETLHNYRKAHSDYIQAYQQLAADIARTKEAHPGGDFRDVDNAFLLLKRPNPSRNIQTLLAEWMDSQTPRDPLGRPMSTTPEVDGLAALVVALLDSGGRYGIKKFFNFK